MVRAAAGLLLCLLCHFVPLEGFWPNCTTDYATELVCHWSVDAATNCSRDVRLRYAQEPLPYRGDGPLPSVCIPEDERGSALAPQCHCRIPGTDFRRAWFFLALEVNGTGAGLEALVKAEQQVKPKRLVNLTADLGRSRSVVLAWQWDAAYTQDQKEDLLLGSPTYEVAYWPVGQREKGLAAETEEQRYEIFAGRLSPGPHAASVRFKVLHFGGVWSEWSHPCGFHVDSGGRLWLLVLWLCAVVLAVTLASYLCFARLKRSCWDRIPNPAKSKVTRDVATKPFSALRKTPPVGERKAPLGDRWERDYENFPGALWPGSATLSAREELLRHGGPGPRLHSLLTPEVPLLESPLVVCSRVLASKVEGPEGEVPAEAAPTHQDAMASLFLQILDCDFRTAEEDPGGQKWPPALDQGPALLRSPRFLLLEPSLGSRAAEEGASPGSYRSFLVESEAPWGASLALQQQQQQPDPSSPTPQQGGGSPAKVPTALLSGYRGLDSLLPQPMASLGPGWEPEGGQRQSPAGDPEGLGPAPALSGGAPWPSSCEAAAAAALDFPLQQKGAPGAAYQNLLRKPGAILCPLVPGYQSFSSALQGGMASSAQQDRVCLGLASHYKPFLTVLRNGLLETQLASGEAWLAPAEDVGRDFLREEQGKGWGGRGLVCP